MKFEADIKSGALGDKRVIVDAANLGDARAQAEKHVRSGRIRSIREVIEETPKAQPQEPKAQPQEPKAKRRRRRK